MENIATKDLNELYQVMAKVLNITDIEVREHASLFIKIDPSIRNCLYYLSQIEDEDLKTTAALSIEFLVKFKQSPFH